MAEKKPLSDISIECPHCQSELRVIVLRERTNPAEKPEYEFDVKVNLTKQGRLFGALKKPDKNTKVSKTG